MRTSLTLLVGLFTAALASAQGQVWTVSAGGGAGVDYKQIQPAVNAAADHDTILVRSGNYPPFAILGRSLTVVADTGAQVTVGSSGEEAVRVELTPPGGEVALRGLALYGLAVANNPGRVWVEDCALTGRPGLEAEASAEVVLVHCSIAGEDGYYCPSYPGPACFFPAGEGVRANNSALFVEECDVRGGDGAPLTSLDPYIPEALGSPTDGGSAAVLTGSTLWTSHSTYAGGAGTDGGGPWMPCMSSSDGGHGLDLTGSSVEALSAVLTAGIGGASVTCYPPSPFGQPITNPAGENGQTALLDAGSSLVELSTKTPDLTTSSPVREGQSISITVVGEPYAIGAVTAALPAAALPLPSLAGVLHIGSPFFVVNTAIADADGTAVFALPIASGALPSALEGVTLRVQGASCPALSCALTPGSTVTVLDGSL